MRHNLHAIMNLKWGLILTLLCLSQQATAQLTDAPPLLKPDPRFKADVLLFVAHPDDETVIGGWMAKAVYDDHRQIAVVYCNRGGGGGNSVGNEKAVAMALIRETEARRALAKFGLFNVWFLDGLDTPGQDVFQSLENWGHGKILEQAVRLIRLTRPEVIMTWMPQYVSGENHGDHQASGVIATEAFDMAGDPVVFPAQVTDPRERIDINSITEGLHPWQAKKIYYFSDADHVVNGPGPRFDMSAVSPSQKVPYYRLAADLHTPHLTQGDVSDVALAALKSGNFTEFVKWLGTFRLIFGKSVVPSTPIGDVFEGISDQRAPFSPPRGYHPAVHKGVTLELGGAFAFYKEFWVAHDIESIGSLVLPEVCIAGGSIMHVPLLLRNDTKDSVTVSVSGEYPPDWNHYGGAGRYRLGPGDVYPIETFYRAPAQQPQNVQIGWKAEINGKAVGRVSMRVSLVQWTLPE